MPRFKCMIIGRKKLIITIFVKNQQFDLKNHIKFRRLFDTADSFALKVFLKIRFLFKYYML